MEFIERLGAELAALAEVEQLRALPEISPKGIEAEIGGVRMQNLSSNDYLGLGGRDELRAEFYEGLCAGDDDGRYALSASSSRLLTGNHPWYGLLEADLESAYGRAALAFNSGYHANVGLIPALAGKPDLILSDKLNHASIIDGVLLSGAKYKRYPHLDYERLEALLANHAGAHRTVFIVTESVFSMDGDVADLARLVELKERYNAVLIVDEAHGVGVFGERGLGVAEEAGLLERCDILVGTFGKAYCSAGAYAVMDEAVKKYLVNKMRTLVFTTGLPPVIVAWSRFVFGKALGMSAERAHLKALWTRLRQGVEELTPVTGYETVGASQIVPVIVGENGVAVRLAEKFRAGGVLLFPIRPPTVPPGTARLRLSLNAGLEMPHVERMLHLLKAPSGGGA